MNAKSRPAGNGTAEVLADGSNYQNATPQGTGPRVSPPVLEIFITADATARTTITNATADAWPGTFIRLHVGHTKPPLWIADAIRDDLVYQVVARDSAALAAWQYALTFGSTR